MAIGITLVGYSEYVTGLLNKLGIEMTDGIRRHVTRLQKRKDRHQKLLRSLDYKRKRQESNRQKMKDHIAKAEKKHWKNGFYAIGEGFNTCIPVEASANCPHCNKPGHKTTTSKHCDMNIHNLKSKAEAEQAKIQEAIDNHYREMTNK